MTHVRRTRRILVRGAGAALALALALGAAELGVAGLDPQPLGAVDAPLLRGPLSEPGDHPIRTPEYDVTVHVNQEGFVDREWGEKAGGRIILLGDSFVQAAQVPMEQGFGRVIEATLGSIGIVGADVLSMGVPGAGTATELGVLDKYALPRSPDLVILAFLVANDVLNNHPLLEDRTDKPFYALDAGKLVKTDAMVLDSGWLFRVSHLYRRLARDSEERRVSERKIARGGGIPIDLHVHNPAPDPTWQQAWTVTQALIAEIARRCEARDVAFATILIPDRVQAVGHSDWPGTESWDVSRAQVRAATMARQHGQVLDLSGTFAGHPELYFETDGHWTADGHRVAGEAAARFAVDVVARRAVTKAMLERPGH